MIRDTNDAPETIEIGGVWYDRRDTVDALNKLLTEARQKLEAYKEVIRGSRARDRELVAALSWLYHAGPRPWMPLCEASKVSQDEWSAGMTNVEQLLVPCTNPALTSTESRPST